ncbi:MAG: 1-(5-phosphoribosyl)-5-[(5-phosphoribosylamino)methylideneamino]imidazole-4-carboxamide isomerase [Spirochaetota bacterium]
MIFIPAIDLIGGKAVRLDQGDYSRKTKYSDNPVDVAVRFQEQGVQNIHIVDLDAARDGSSGNIDTIKEILHQVDISVEVGGGVRSRERVGMLLEMGVGRVILGTIIVKNPEGAGQLVEEFGDRVVAGIDAKNGIVRVSGWKESSTVKAVDLGLKVREMGFTMVVYTDISRDGMMEGPNIPEIENMAWSTGLPIIAAGGISSVNDLKMLKPLGKVGLKGVIAGKAVYEGKISVKEACRVLCD